MNNNNKNTTTKTETHKQAAGDAKSSDSTVKAEQIKLGIDVHLDRYVVVRIIDGGTPQPPQRFEPAEFMLWVAKQLVLANKVFTCYEAGPFGYSLHRKLEKLGATNYVVRPRDWDEYGKKVKTDKRDAKQLALHLDLYVNGNRDAFWVVRVPSPAKSRSAASRGKGKVFSASACAWQHRDAVTRSHALYYGEHIQRRMVERSSLETFGGATAGDRGESVGAFAPAHR